MFEISDKNPPVVNVGIRRPSRPKHCRPHVGVIGPSLIVLASGAMPGPDKAHPGIGDLGLNPAVIPGKCICRRSLGTVIQGELQLAAPVNKK